MNKIKNLLGVVFGIIFVVLGVIGIFLPLLPTTPFLLLAAALFIRSSNRLYNWLINNKYLGNYIKNYREGKGIPYRAKVVSIMMLWITIIYSAVFVVQRLFVKIILVTIAILVTLHILSLKTLKLEDSNDNISENRDELR